MDIKRILDDLDISGQENINVVNLSDFISQNGVMVDLKITGGNQAISIPVSRLNEVTEETGKFLSSHFKSSKLVFIDDKTTKELMAIKNTARRALYNNSIMENGKFLTLDSYKKFKKIFNECKKEYQEISDQLIASYKNLRDSFEVNTKKYLEDILGKDYPEQVKPLYKYIVARIPTESQFKNSFKFQQNVFCFPSTQSKQITFSDPEIVNTIDDSIYDKSMELVTGAFCNLGNTLYKNACKLIDKEMLSNSELESIYDDIARVKSLNLFNSKSINTWIQELENLIANQDSIDKDNAEVLVAEIYNEYVLRNLDESLPSFKKINKKYLENIREMYC